MENAPGKFRRRPQQGVATEADGRRACVVFDVLAGEETVDADPIYDIGITTSESRQVCRMSRCRLVLVLVLVHG